jgi:ribosomal protein S18 acetylase RimI-like enzyme
VQIETVDAAIVRPLRAEVLRPGQAPEQLIYDGDQHPASRHWAAIIEGRVVGVASVMRDEHPREPHPGDWRIRGMASSAELRGRGIGGELLARCVGHAREQDGARLWCNARVRAVGFYEKAGFVVESELFEIPSIGSHRLMSKALQRG